MFFTDFIQKLYLSVLFTSITVVSLVYFSHCREICLKQKTNCTFEPIIAPDHKGILYWKMTIQSDPHTEYNIYSWNFKTPPTNLTRCYYDGKNLPRPACVCLTF